MCVCVCVCITRLASNETFSPSNKIQREVGRAKDLSATLYIVQSYILLSGEKRSDKYLSICTSLAAVLEGNTMPYEDDRFLDTICVVQQQPDMTSDHNATLSVV
jgi:hypothetical protein